MTETTSVRRRGPRPGVRLKLAAERLTGGRRLGLSLLAADHARLTTAADAAGITVAALARQLILSGLADAT